MEQRKVLAYDQHPRQEHRRTTDVFQLMRLLLTARLGGRTVGVDRNTNRWIK